ncbi:hypothetical protein DFJ74DRAFT_660132 [Hyaloraphidium curvatum]|nr:hypothetical protein DFJ74DRAFT_660132 [Hyaloraphidium curvatum]
MFPRHAVGLLPLLLLLSIAPCAASPLPGQTQVDFAEACGACDPSAYCEFAFPGTPRGRVACVRYQGEPKATLYRRYSTSTSAGTVVCSQPDPAPCLQVSEGFGASAAIPDGGTSQPPQLVALASAVPYSIRNFGSVPLDVTLTITGGFRFAAGDLLDQLVFTSIGFLTITSFNLVPTVAGTGVSGVVTIATNDPLRPLFSFTVVADVTSISGRRDRRE